VIGTAKVSETTRVTAAAGSGSISQGKGVVRRVWTWGCRVAVPLDKNENEAMEEIHSYEQKWQVIVVTAT
jgi:hypothetical protein